jgi:hypothetical protein
MNTDARDWQEPSLHESALIGDSDTVSVTGRAPLDMRSPTS